MDYGVDNKIDKVNEAVFDGPSGSGLPSGYRTLWRFQYESGFLKRILYEMPPLPDTNTIERHTRYKFDYGLHGIEKVYYYDFALVSRFDFKYENFDKPISMIQYLNVNQGGPGGDDMKAIYSFKYEYDNSGNVVKESFEILDNPESPNNYVANYKYDSSPNSVKLFECFGFSYKSAAAVFSENNLIEKELVYKGNKPQTSIVTHFDSQTNYINQLILIAAAMFFQLESD